MFRHRILAGFLLLGGLTCLLFAPSSMAAGGTGDAVARRAMLVEMGTGEMIEGSDKVAALFVADPSVADVQGSPETGYFVYGIRSGRTTILASDFDGRRLFSIDLAVIQNLDEVRQLIDRRFPDARVSLQAARGSVMLSGTVPDERVHQDLLNSLKPLLPDSILVDNLSQSESGIIQLDMRIIGVSRNKATSYGVNWAALVNAEPFIQLLIHNGAATVVNETTMTTSNGQTASFTSGEQIAIPSAPVVNFNDGRQDSGISFKQIGLQINFTPTLLPGNRISLAIDSELSHPASSSQSVNGNTYPNITTQSYKTTVPLEPKQTYIISGLSNLRSNADTQQERADNAIGKVLRFLFGHDSIQASDEDFLIAITAYLGDQKELQDADPVGKPEDILEYLLSQKSTKGAPVRLYGQAGFDY